METIVLLRSIFPGPYISVSVVASYTLDVLLGPVEHLVHRKAGFLTWQLIVPAKPVVVRSLRRSVVFCCRADTSGLHYRHYYGGDH